MLFLRTSDGNCLIVSSTDGYCTIIKFEEGEIGVPYSQQVVPTTKRFYPSTDQPTETSVPSEPMTLCETTAQPLASPSASQPMNAENVLHTPEKSPSVSLNMDIHKKDYTKINNASAMYRILLSGSRLWRLPFNP